MPGCAMSREVGDPAAEQAVLVKALAKARMEVGDLVGTLEGADAGIMEFQAAMLEDPELSYDARVAIAAGMPADMAWSQGIESEIQRYRCAASAHFRALATDLEDIRDRVLRRILRQPEPVQAGAGQILVADDLPPSAFLQVDWSKGGAVNSTDPPRRCRFHGNADDSVPVW